MKRLLLALAVLRLAGHPAAADVISQWNFNSSPPDSSTTTGSTSSSAGTSSAELLGGLTATFVSGGPSDPASSDNTAWSTTKYPSTMLADITAGVRFRASTVGYENIQLSWHQYNSGTASRYAIVQFTIDGTNFFDLATNTITRASTYTNFFFDLAGIAGAKNNPNFGFQVMAAFERTAIGGLPGYIGTDGEYGPSGTIRFEMVTISGQQLSDGNTAPFIISQIRDQVLPAMASSPVLSFTVVDAEDPAANLVIEKGSSNPAVIPLGNIVLGGQGANRTATVQAGGVAGSSRVELKVVDTGGKYSTLFFNVTVLPANSAPTILGPSFGFAAINGSTNLSFTVQDADTAAALLTVSATAQNASLLPHTGLQISGSSTNRTITLTPGKQQAGVTPVTLSVSDGTNVTSHVFPLMVLPRTGQIFYEPFGYQNGAVTTNSGGLWAHRSGAFGDCEVTNHTLRLSSARQEDIGGTLIGAPYETNSGAMIYAAFKLRASALPSLNPDCIFHLLSGATLVGKISVGITNAFQDCYRLYVGNGPNEVPLSFPMDIVPNVLHQVVMRYNVSNAVTTLWVDPANENSISVTAPDSQTPAKISTFGLRQSTGIGPELFVDDLRIGLSFEDVTGPLPIHPLLSSTLANNKVCIVWEDPLHRLQCSSSANGMFTNVPATSPYLASPAGAKAFFRLKVQ